MVVYHHVATYLARVESIVCDFHHTHHLERNDVEHIDVERHIAAMHKHTLEPPLAAVDKARNLMRNEESCHSGEWQRSHIADFR